MPGGMSESLASNEKTWPPAKFWNGNGS
jgi:hypothetical protein